MLDIGAGTGLLSLMIAQNLPYRIDAVEIDPASAGQAKENITRSRWNDRITLHNIALQDFVPGSPYDIIISNPPFYDGDLNSPSAAANMARHNISLSFIELLNFITENLKDEGSSFFIGAVPPARRVIVARPAKPIDNCSAHRCKKYRQCCSFQIHGSAFPK